MYTGDETTSRTVLQPPAVFNHQHARSMDTAPASPLTAGALVQLRDQHGPEPAPGRDQQVLPPRLVGLSHAHRRTEGQ